MLHGVLSYLKRGAGILDLAKDAVNTIHHANAASNLSLSKKQRKEARIAFVENLFNVAVPVGLGVAAVVSGGGALTALPVVLGTHAVVRNTGIGRQLGILLEPVLSPVFNGIGFLKSKIKKAFGWNVDKKVHKGTTIAAHLVENGKAVIHAVESAKQDLEVLAKTKTFTPAQTLTRTKARTHSSTEPRIFKPFRKLMRCFS